MSLLERDWDVIATTSKSSPAASPRRRTAKRCRAWDSPGQVNIVMALEQTFDLMIQVEDFESLQSVPAIVAYRPRSSVHHYCGPKRTLAMPAFCFGENGEGAYASLVRNPRFDLRGAPWKLRKIMAPGTLAEWRFHYVAMFATRAAQVTEQLVAAARRGVTLYDPL